MVEVVVHTGEAGERVVEVQDADKVEERTVGDNKYVVEVKEHALEVEDCVMEIGK